MACSPPSKGRSVECQCRRVRRRNPSFDGSEGVSGGANGADFELDLEHLAPIVNSTLSRGQTWSLLLPPTCVRAETTHQPRHTPRGSCLVHGMPGHTIMSVIYTSH